ncbi:MAG: CHAD domain-containing protein [Planctomycetota bacterium]|nr:CHAD domain-containing protein [Planctomycetota bacterium]
MPQACDTAYCALCARAIRDRAAAARALIAPVREAADTEAVHDMRVATRRLRSALTLFEPCLPRRARTWRKAVRRITRALGRARDLDVQIETLQAAIAAHPAWREGLTGLLATLTIRRRAAQREVVSALARSRRRGVLEEIDSALARIAQALPPRGAAWEKAFRRAQKAVLGLLDDLMSYQGDLKRPRAGARHHRMRIAAKWLRYSLEVFEPMYGRSVARALRAAKGMQSLLGDMHDSDVWEELLGELPPAPSDSARTLEAFARDRRRRRRALYEQALTYWRKCQKEHVWPQLRHTLAAAGVPKPPRRRRAPGAAKPRAARSR